MNERILIIDDDAVVQDVARSSLERDGYVVHVVGEGGEGISMTASRAPALIVLDLGLPDMAGETVLQEVRRRSQVPIIVLSAKGRMEERVAGLGLGADDYLAKPFSPNELVARVRALLRRTQRSVPSVRPTTSYGPIELDADQHTVSFEGRDVTLTAKEFLLLEYLLQHRGRVLSRDLLLTDVWGYRYTGGTRTVDVHVRRLREKLPVLADALVTVKQFGYKLLDPAPQASA